jgi:hypothetical protein
MKKLAVLTFAAWVLACPAVATQPEEMVEKWAQAVPSSQLEEDDWPFMEMAPVLQDAIRTAVADNDVQSSIGTLASALREDRGTAVAVLSVSLQFLEDPWCESVEPKRAALAQGALLEAIAAYPASPEATSILALLLNTWQRCLPEAGRGVLAVADSIPEPDLAVRLARRLSTYHPLRLPLLRIARERDAASLGILEALAESDCGELIPVLVREDALALARRENPARVAEFEERYLEALLAAGLWRRAAEAFRVLSPEARDALLAPAHGWGDWNIHGGYRLDLVAALLLAGDPTGARRLLEGMPTRDRTPREPEPEASYEASEAAARQAVDARLWQVLHRQLSPKAVPGDPFDLLAELALERNASSTHLGSRDTLVEALAVFSLQEGYPGFAKYFLYYSRSDLESDRLLLTDDSTPMEEWWLGGFPDLHRRALNALEELELAFEGLHTELASSAPEDPMARRIAELAVRPRLALFPESPLPKGVPAGSAEARSLPKGIPYPADLSVVRVEQEGAEVVVVGLAQDLDPVGEVSQGGYWVARSHDGGATWQRLYTGLRHLQPYEVVPLSRLPLRHETGLRVEVRVRELDENSITFPPIGVRLLREVDGLFLEMPWEALERDRDGDGLTDLVEERLLTDPEDPDTDGDGVDDASDPLAAVPYSANADARTTALASLLGEIQGEEAAAILPRCADGDGLCFGRPALGQDGTQFVVGPRHAWRGLSPTVRTVVLSPDEVKVIHDKFGILFATRFPLLEVDRQGRHSVIIWSRSWQGGAALLTLEEDGWTVEIRYRWIT